jgi:hypothetical protein
MRLLLEMAFTRAAYKDQLEHKLTGALIHFYKIEYAKANSQQKWMNHWATELKRLLDEFQTLLLHSIKGSWNRTKAAREVVVMMRANNNQYQTVAYNTVCRDFNKRFKKSLPDTIIVKFWTKVDNIISDTAI